MALHKFTMPIIDQIRHEDIRLSKKRALVQNESRFCLLRKFSVPSIRDLQKPEEHSVSPWVLQALSHNEQQQRRPESRARIPGKSQCQIGLGHQGREMHKSQHGDKEGEVYRPGHDAQPHQKCGRTLTEKNLKFLERPKLAFFLVIIRGEKHLQGHSVPKMSAPR
jgi:hypothetical protein